MGKTTAAVALAHEFFGETWHMNFRELNASDERGIDVVRNQIKEFARTSPLGGAEFKILFLDEADALTTDAQAALRRTMETYARTCRFILSCNYSSKIIDPIQSRCAIYRFRPLTQAAIGEEIRRIAKSERLTVTRDAIEAIAYVAQGDMRRAINALQGAAMVSDEVDESMVYASTATARPDEIRRSSASSWPASSTRPRACSASSMYDRGIAPGELLGQCYRALVKQPMLRELKVELIEHLGETDFRLSEGGTPELQMEALLARCVRSAGRYARDL